MKKLILLLAALLAFPMAAAGEECKYIGSWLGYDSNGELYWTGQMHGMNSSHGTILLEVPGFDFSFGGLFDVASYTGNLKGAWVRTGRHTYSSDSNGIATDDTGAAVYVIRLACDVSLAESCNVLEVLGCDMMLYVPDPAFDPIPIWDRDPDIGPISFPPHNGYRMTVD